MVFDMPSCGACRTCEIVCSYHHTGAFNPEVSSLRILDKQSGPGFYVELIEEQGGRRVHCDGCRGLDEPLCMAVCKEKEDLGKMIEAFAGQMPR